MASPLLNLMKDQVDKLANLGILASSLNDISEENARAVRAEMFKEREDLFQTSCTYKCTIGGLFSRFCCFL